MEKLQFESESSLRIDLPLFFGGGVSFSLKAIS